MKKKFSKILGAGLTLALLCSLLLTAAPVSALGQPVVTFATDQDAVISEVNAHYIISFRIDEELEGTVTITGEAVGTGDNSTTVFPLDYAPVVADSETIYLDAVETTAYSLADTTGVITFTTAPGSGVVITADYITTDTDTESDDSIVVTFPDDTVVADSPVPTVQITAWCTDAAGAGLAETLLDETVAVVDGQEVTITWKEDATITTLGTVVVEFPTGITNPDVTGAITLTVATSQEAAVTSAAYTITEPTIEVLPGIVQQYNAATIPILMAQATGDDAINKMVDSAQADYTIIVGPGEYKLNGTLGKTIELDQAGLTLKSSAGAEDTIIVVDGDLDADAIQITVADVTVDGFTIEDTEQPYTAIKVTGDDATVINNIMTDTTETGYPEGISIEGSAAGATVTGNELDIYHTMMVQVAASGCTLSDNTFGAGINLHNAPSDITITGNDLIGVELWGIVLWNGGTYTNVLIEGNTISETTLGDAIGICIQGTAEIDNLQILGNDITDNEGVGILIDSGVEIVAASGSAIAIKFNTITGNDADNDGYGIQNDATNAATVVDAALNWWGTAVADDVAAMVNDTVTTGSVTIYEPFLADTADAVFSATDVAVGEASLDAKTTVGVRVEDATNATVISAAKYVANPQEAIADAIAFYDVYVATATVDVTIKFYAGDANSKLYVWSADTEAWADLSEDASFGFSVYGGYIYVDYDAALLGGTPFALVAGAVEAPGTPEILAPVTGDDDVSLTPIFAWEAATGADGYYFEFADNANFVTPLVKLDGDLGRLVVTAYAYVGELPYSEPYYWRVKAVSGTVAAGNLAESAWSTGVFITMDEPEEELPPVVVEEAPPVIIEPIVEVITPAATEITPAWIYVIIGVGAVLVIALLVLIVRTRRVA